MRRGSENRKRKEDDKRVEETKNGKRKENTINIFKAILYVCACVVLVARRAAVRTQACWAARQRETW